MDPTEWPLIVKLLAGWGPLGVWVAFSEMRATRLARSLAAIEERHRKALTDKDEMHRKQLDQVTDKMIRIVENQSRQAQRLADGVNERIRRSKEEESP